MAANSKRERIILSDVSLLESSSSITTVERRLPTFSDLGQFALTQFPVAAVVGRIPIPVNHRYKGSGQVDQIISRLRVDVYVYMQENVNADSEISDILDDIWAVLYQNPTRNNLCIVTQLEAEEETETWPPFVAFKISCLHQYQHSTEGI